MTIYSHCGVVSLTHRGRLWLVTPRLGGHSPPAGWDQNQTPGSLSVTARRRGVFVREAGQTARFRIAAPGTAEPNAGVAGSGGYYELHRVIEPPCGFGGADAPPELTGLRAISLTASWETTSACMDWWGVTLFLEGDEVRGVVLRLGSP